VRKQHQLSPNSFVWALPPPSTAHLFELIKSSRRSEVVYRDPYYSNPDDVPKVAHVYGGRVFNLKADSIKYLPPFKHQTLSSNGIGQPAYRKRSGITSWEYYARPPAAKEMRDWLESELNASSAQRRAARISSQVSPFTPRFSGSCTDWDRT
jgi:DNA polymerase zeta